MDCIDLAEGDDQWSSYEHDKETSSSVGLWRWYTDIKTTILNVIYRTVFHLKHKVSENWFCLRLQAAGGVTVTRD
jgi:hypothetical protein